MYCLFNIFSLYVLFSTFAFFLLFFVLYINDINTDNTNVFMSHKDLNYLSDMLNLEMDINSQSGLKFKS